MGAQMDNPLPGIIFLFFPRTPVCANICAWSGSAKAGQGHNATTNRFPCVVAPVVGKSPLKTEAYPPPTTPQRKISPLIHVIAHARAREANVPLCRCAVVVSIYHIDNKEIYKNIGHNKSHNGADFAGKSVVDGVVASPNPLENNKKGCFYV